MPPVSTMMVLIIAIVSRAGEAKIVKPVDTFKEYSKYLYLKKGNLKH